MTTNSLFSYQLPIIACKNTHPQYPHSQFLYNHSDPTLTVENVVQVMKATEIDKRLNLWALILFPENTAKILRGTARSDTYYAEIYVTCSPFSSWKHLAKQLYNQDQIQAVEKIQHHLPPRGE